MRILSLKVSMAWSSRCHARLLISVSVVEPSLFARKKKPAQAAGAGSLLIWRHKPVALGHQERLVDISADA
jgi:hypothetical protein